MLLFSLLYIMRSIHGIIALSGTLALGFLLVVLAVALYGKWTPLLAALLFAMAPLPQLGGKNDDLFDTNGPNGGELGGEWGNFLSSGLLTSAVGLPLVLCHSGLLPAMATALAETGGLAIYATIVVFSHSFQQQSESF